MNILIQKIRIHNFRSIQHTEIPLTHTNVLVGVNNSGKTSFLKALSLAIGVDKKYVTRDDLFINKEGEIAENEFYIDLYIIPTDEDGEQIQEFSEPWTILFGEDIQTDSSGNDFFAFRTHFSFKRSNSEECEWKRYYISEWDNTENINNQRLRANLERIPLFFIEAQRDLQEELKVRNSYFGRLAVQMDFGEELQNLEADLNELNEKAVEKSEELKHLREELKLLNRTMQTQGEGVQITPLPRRIRDLHKSMRVLFQDGGSESFGMEYHGMGTRSWASLLAFKAYISWEQIQNTKDEGVFHPILALEEPEAHLHPNAQRHLYGQLADIKGQKIISTHSPYVAAQAQINEIKLFFKSSDATEIKVIEDDFETQIEEVLRKLDEPLTKINRKVNRELRKELATLKAEQRKYLRKYYNVLMRTHGEILFSKAIVLFEGESEDQALPIFAKEFFGCSPFEKGITFIGVGGHGSYRPFVRLAQNLRIPWFIFSDGEAEAISSISKLKEELQLDEDSPNIIILENGNDLEEYLVEEGYQEELKEAIFITSNPDTTNERSMEAARSRIAGLDDPSLIEKLKSDKTGLSPIYSEQISKLEQPRNVPSRIRELFSEIENFINPQAIGTEEEE